MKLNFKQRRIQKWVTDLRWFLAFARLSSLLFTLLLLRVGPFQFLGPCCFGLGPRRLFLAAFLLPGLGQGEGLVLLALNVPLVREEEPVEVGVVGWKGEECQECKRRNANEIVVTVKLCHVTLAETQLQMSVSVYNTQTQIILRKTII